MKYDMKEVNKVMEMDLSIFRLLIMNDDFEDISGDLEKFDSQDCYFFYDESNNIRKLWMDENDFNAPVDSDFVLGGVMHFGKKSIADIGALKSEMRLQKSADEMKFKHISRSKDFLNCLSEPKVKIFLEWLYQSELYVHYSNINNLYWAIVDIVDSINESAYIPFNHQMKNELYNLARLNYLDFYQLLTKCEYPNVTSKNIVPFCQGIIDLIENIPGELPFGWEVLRQGLNTAKKQNNLIFLQGNAERTVIDSYFHFYLRPVGVFSSSQHIFDNEYQIEKQFKKYKLQNDGKEIDNYRFVDSKDNALIQVSDCMVGLLGKYYTYINTINIIEAQQMFKTLASEQRSTLKLFSKVIKKSEDFSKLLLCASESIEERMVGGFILNNAL